MQLVGSGVALGGSQLTGRALGSNHLWSIVALPDMQKYTDRSSLLSFAQDQTDWVVNNLESENIAFVTHEGDLVENGSSTTEWDRVDGVMSTLDGDRSSNPDGLVPYATTPGDHDWAVEEDRSSSTENYRQYFGQSRYDDRSWFGGSAPNDLSHYQLFSAGSYDFLHIDLEWEAPGTAGDSSTPLGWAQSILDQYPDRPTIITTHSYIWDGNPPGRTTFVEENSGNGSSGQELWQEIVEPNPQVFMVLCGNFHEASGSDNGEYHQVSTNNAGLPVYEMLANYQDYPNGGDGWLRLIQFVPGGGSDGEDRIRVRTYSPSRDEFATDSSSQFEFDLKFQSRFSMSSSSPPDTGSVTLQQGVDSYAGTVDTYLQEDDPSANNATATTLNVDDDDPRRTGRDVQALVRFDDLVGNGSNQVPPGATVSSAKLTVETTNDGDGAALHRMRESWSDTDSWETFGGDGIQADDVEADATVDASIGPITEGPTTLDVTTSVQAWADGQANLGWAFLPRGRDGWDFYAAEGSVPPQLDVTYQTASSDGGGGDTSVAVSTDDASEVGETTATLNGTLTDLGGASSADVFFEYRPVGTTEWTTTAPQAVSSTGAFSEATSGLTAETDYEFRARAIASDGDTATGSTLSFSTTADPAVVVATDEASGIGETVATLNGTLSDLGGAASVDVFFEYRATGATSWTATTPQTRSTTGSFSESLSGLSSETDYEVRAVANASDGDSATGSTRSFITLADPAVVVVTDSASDVRETTATLSGTLSDLGGAASADVNFEYRESGASSWLATTMQTRSTTGSFSESLTGLTPGANYEFRALAAASDGDTATGDTLTFTTTEPPSTTETVTFQQGAAGYGGTVDTYLQEDDPSANNATARTLNVDDDDPSRTGRDVQALLRFENIVGSGAGQIPPGASVSSATLTVETTNDGDGATLHRMLQSWSATDSWTTFGGDGVQADDVEAMSTIDETIGPILEGPRTMDVTTSVRAWADGQANLGWAFLPRGRDGWDFYSAEGTVPPRLEVTFDAGSGGGDRNVAVSTDAASNVGETTATLNGTLTDLGGASSADVSFEYREVGATEWTTTAPQTVDSTGAFSDTVTGLSSGSDYDYRAVANASDGDTATGQTVSFTTTVDTSVAVSTDAATDIGETTVTLNGTLSDLGGAASADVFFEYREVGSTGWTATASQTKSSTGAFSDPVSGLTSETEYEYRAVASASDGDTATGSIVSFTTAADAVVAVSTDDASEVGETTATLNGTLTDLGGASSVDVSFEYRSVGESNWTATATQTLSATGSFSESLSDLTAETDYEFRAVADASDGDSATGSTRSFSTTADPAVVVSTDSASAISETTATLNGTLSDLGGAASADVSFEYRESGTSDWASTPTQTVSATGSFSDSVSGLTPGTDYEFRALATASDGDTATGSTLSFTTTADPAVVVVTDSASDVTETTATLSGTLSDLGGAASADVSFEYRLVGASSWSSTPLQTLSSTGPFSESLSGLAPGSDYEFRATAAASDGDTATGDTLTFTTTEPPASGPQTVTFQQGTAGYSGTVDTYLQEDDPSANNATATTLNVDDADPGGTGRDVQALLRFENIVGDGSGQIPSGSTVSSATLTVETTNDGDGATLHRMLQSWSATDSWETFGGDGIQADDVEAMSTIDETIGPILEGPRTMDVTTSIQAWADGQVNHGWAFLPRGRDGWDFYSAEGTVPPRLEVTFE